MPFSSSCLAIVGACGRVGGADRSRCRQVFQATFYDVDTLARAVGAAAQTAIRAPARAVTGR
jgi:hypothetical protein